MKRIFIALPILDKIAASLIPLQTGLEGARFSPRENLHITLRFIGDTQEDIIADLAEELGRIEFAAFELSLAGIGHFGNEKPHSIHALVNDCPELVALHSKIDRICHNFGFAKDHKKYIPHVTLAYLNNHALLSEVIEFEARNNLFKSKAWRAETFALYYSKLSKGPSQYKIIAQYDLDFDE